MDNSSHEGRRVGDTPWLVPWCWVLVFKKASVAYSLVKPMSLSWKEKDFLKPTGVENGSSWNRRVPEMPQLHRLLDPNVLTHIGEGKSNMAF